MMTGPQMVEAYQKKVDDLTEEVGEKFVWLVKELFEDPRLANIAETAEADAQHVAAQITCLGVSSAINTYPGSEDQKVVLVGKLLAHCQRYIQFEENRR